MKTWYNKKQEQIEKYKYFIMLNLEHDELKELSKKIRWQKDIWKI